MVFFNLKDRQSLYSTLDDFSDDALAAIDYLKSREDLKISGIGLFGHCAGATAAIRAAVKSDEVAFLITMAACAMDGENTLLHETRAMLENQERSEEDIIELQALRTRLFRVIRTDEGWPEITEDIRLFVQKRYDNLDPSIKSKYPEFKDFYKQTYDKAYITYFHE